MLSGVDWCCWLARRDNVCHLVTPEQCVRPWSQDTCPAQQESNTAPASLTLHTLLTCCWSNSLISHAETSPHCCCCCCCGWCCSWPYFTGEMLTWWVSELNWAAHQHCDHSSPGHHWSLMTRAGSMITGVTRVETITSFLITLLDSVNIWFLSSLKLKMRQLCSVACFQFLTHF